MLRYVRNMIHFMVPSFHCKMYLEQTEEKDWFIKFYETFCDYYM